MRRMLSGIILTALLLCGATALVSAQEGTEAQEEMQKQLLEESADRVSQSGAPLESFQFSETVQKVADGEWEWNITKVLNRIAELFLGEVRSNLSALLKIIVIAVLAGILCNLQGPFNGEGVADVSFLVCFIVIAGLAVSVFAEIVQTAMSTIDSLTLFMQGLIPSMTGIIAAGGGAASGMALSPSLFLCMQVITYLAKNVFLPMILVITALSVINNMSGRFHITKLIEFARQALKWSSGILLTVFIGILSLQGFSSAFVDGVAGKTVKYAICNFVPLVGNVLSDSVEAVCASTLVVKNAVGVTGVLALLSICVGPLLKLLAISVLYRFAAGVAEPATDRRIVNLLGDLAGNITQTFVILLMVCVMFIISVAMLCAVTNIPMMMR